MYLKTRDYGQDAASKVNERLGSGQFASPCPCCSGRLGLEANGSLIAISDLGSGFDVITPAEYIAWVKRSLNRLFNAGLVVDATTPEPYREAVRRLQREHGLPTTGDVNETTQNAIIKANERERNYLVWVQRALESDSIFTDPPRSSPASGGSFKSEGLRLGIRSFQNKHTLKVDGFVGAKTETLLMRVCRCTPPGHIVMPPREVPKPKPKPEPDPDPKKRLQEVKRHLTDETLLCLVNKMLDPPVFYFTPASINQYIGTRLGQADITGFMFDLRDVFEKRLERNRKVLRVEPSLATIQDWLGTWKREIIDSVDTVKFADGSIPQGKRVRREVHRLSKQPGSAYNCKRVKERVDRVMSKVGPPTYSGVWTDFL
jgi:hypothetical protein